MYIFKMGDGDVGIKIQLGNTHRWYYTKEIVLKFIDFISVTFINTIFEMWRKLN